MPIPRIFAALVVCLGILLAFSAGCSSPSGSPGLPQETSAGGIAPGAGGPDQCRSADECRIYCAANKEICEAYCKANPDTCSRIPGIQKSGGPMAGTSCDTDLVRDKMRTVIERVLVSPPSSFSPPNWMTKILPAGNPYPGYYYSLSTAFGPAIDAQKGTAWSGEGEPPRTPGLDYYTVGIWDEKPKGSGATLGGQTPATLDLSRYQLAVFYTNVSAPSQAAMINALPDLTMTEAEAKAFFASKIKKSFIDIDARTLSRAGPKMYEVRWHDSTNTQDYWDVQIGTGYIAIGQGKVYTDESLIAGDPGTMWRFHACRPCQNCADWTVESSFNRDCTTDPDCIGGLACNGGYCMKPGAGTATGGMTTGKGPGSPCSAAADCGAGLSCTNSICSIPTGPR